MPAGSSIGPIRDSYRGFNRAQKVADGLIDGFGRKREAWLDSGAKGAAAIERTEYGSEFGNSIWGSLEHQHPDAAERLAEIVTEPDASPIQRNRDGGDMPSDQV